MDALPLPLRPDLEQYKKRAKELVSAANSDDEQAVRAWAGDWLRAGAPRTTLSLTPFVEESLERAVESIEQRVRERTSRPGSRLALADAQFVVARAHGFRSWADFSHHVQRLSGEGGDGDPFEAAADAVVGGDLAALESLVRAHPELVRARSARVHRATLLHYVAANGVEDFRQTTPANAVAVARFLLEAGSAVDAVADTYEGGAAQTAMNLLVSSAHPAAAGVQSALVELLLDFGAAIEGLANDGSPLMTALRFWHVGAAETLARRGARLDNVAAAAAVGREDLVRRLVVDGATLSREARSVRTQWLSIPADAKAQIGIAFVWSIKYRRLPIVRFLLEVDVDPAATDIERMSALHWASANGLTDVIEELLRRGAPLEAENVWGGTVLSSTAYFAVHGPVPGVDYPAVLERLIAAGADVGRAAWAANVHGVGEVLRRGRMRHD